MSRTYQIQSPKIILLGDTFSIKEDIKKLGGKWDPSFKYWWTEENENILINLNKLGFSETALTVEKQVSLSVQPVSREMSITQFVSYMDQIIRKNLNEKYWVYGEISSIKTANGHIFFDLVDKDEKTLISTSSFKTSSIPCIIWAGKKMQLAEKLALIPLQDGTKIKILISCDFKKEGAKICSIVEDINEQYTQGNLLLQRLAIVQELKKRGLYNKNKTLKLKVFPLKIALITAENSKAAADFKDELKMSEIAFKVTLFDCNMQGENTSNNVCSALKVIAAQSIDFDCIILTRGGGSRIDLRFFDDLEICKQIAYSPLPVITAIGHFEDVSIADEVSFFSEKTPTAAARFLSFTVTSSLITLFNKVEAIGTFLLKKIAREKQKILTLENNLSISSIKRIENEKKQILNIEQILRVYKLSIEQTLKRGFILAYDEFDRIVFGKDFLSPKKPEKLRLKFANNESNEHIFVDVLVVSISKKEEQAKLNAK